MATWESLYIASEQYTIHKLSDMARTALLNGLYSPTAIPSLFRIGYKHQKLRAPTLE